MNDWRIELSGFNDLGVERLKAFGLISEIVSWKLKLYVPAGAAGAAVFARLVDRFPIQRVADRKAACRSPAMDNPVRELARRLGENAEAVCRPYPPNGRRQGPYLMDGAIHNST